MREHGLSETTFYSWKVKYANGSVAELTRLKYVEEENWLLKQMFAELSMEKQAIKEIFAKKVASRAARSQAAPHGLGTKGWSQRRACGLVGLSRGHHRQVAQHNNEELVRKALRTLTERHPGWNF